MSKLPKKSRAKAVRRRLNTAPAESPLLHPGGKADSSVRAADAALR